MSFNKSKAMRNAERYLTQGKIQAAISEYRQIVEHEPKDINSRNMLGDLYIKANDNQSAINCYKEVAEHYNSQGFAKKAIAIYNKLYRLEPDSMEIALKLADLYQTRGSLAEAQTHYGEIAKRYEQKGRKAEALAIWEKIAEISPRDTEIYIKIADAYWQNDRQSEAAEAFVQAGSRFVEAENYQEAATAFSRSLEVNKDDFFALRGFVKAQISLGYPEEGAKALEKALEKEPFNKEINYLIMDCYFEMGNLEKAEELILKLIEREPANYPKLVELSKVYLENDDLDSVVRLLTMTSEHQLVSGESDELNELINEVLARNPEHLECLRLLARYYGWLRDELQLKQTLERLADAARLNNAFEDEQFALSQYLLMSPHDTARSNRLKEIRDLYGISNDAVQVEQLLNPQSKDIPTYESFANLSNDESLSNNDVQIVDEQNIVVTDNVEIVSGEQIILSDETFASENHFESNDFDAQAIENFAESTDFNEVISTEIPEENTTEDADLSPSDEMKFDEEVESVKFYIEQGYTNLAEKAFADLEKSFGNRQQVVELREKLFGSNTSGSESFDEVAETENVIVENVEADIQTPDADVYSPTENVSSNESANEFVDENVGVEEFVVAEESHEAFEESAKEEFKASDFAENLEQTESVETSETVSQEFVEEEISATEEFVEEESRYTNSFESLRDELAFEESEEEIESDDYEEHYQRATVYQEMGLLEEALRGFQDAVKCVQANDGTRRFFNCCTLIGHCFMEKEMPNPALQWFERAFETPELTVEEKQAINYEIANAYEVSGEYEKAFEQFELIYAMDVDYRNVSERLETLREKMPTFA